MRAAVEKDTTVREIILKLVGVPDIDITRAWHSKPRSFRPGKAVIRIVDGETRSITVTGGLVLKSGQASTEQSGKRDWRRDSYSPEDKVSTAPGWVKILWDEAPQGVTSWLTGTDADNA
jgi:hypothetical protein